ncbi:IAA-alanine resistance protein 1 [Hibiscus syriacus]|uniref:IAA-alanine resistance protein 1 n=1 Tax=Hibiscus syriacus TaxID=106335 RepID=A0A6A3D5F0_HIBSY|nr:IAA-alanine resistance protein 1 [Hibiscus syriacus]
MSFTPFYFSPQFPSVHLLESQVVVRGQPGLDGGGMDMDLRRKPHAVEFDVDFFCPVEHPMEPVGEDRPVECPMSAASSSSIYVAESSRKRSEQRTTANNGIAARAMTAEPPVRAVRKRHHP